jgi:dTDP-4-dehydrorhamnose reductase
VIRARVVVTGASGLLGHALCRYLVDHGYAVIGLRRHRPIDVPGVEEVSAELTNHGPAAELVRATKPDWLIHTAALADVDACETDPAVAWTLNVETSRVLAAEAAALGTRFLYVSTDQLWDGRHPFLDEGVPPAPLNTYGHSKAAGETATVAANPAAIVARTNFFGPGRPWRRSFSDWVLDSLSASRTITLFRDVYVTPIATHHLCEALVELLAAETRGIIHIAGRDRVSKLEFGRRLARAFGHGESLIREGSVEDVPRIARRPKDMSLAVGRIESLLGRRMPSLDAGIETLRETSRTLVPASGTTH